MNKIKKLTIIISIAVLSLLPVASIYGNDQSPEQLFKDARQAPNEEAIRIYQRIIKKYPGTENAARAQRSIGTHYFWLKKYDQAIEAYQRYIDNYPEEGPERIAATYSVIGTVYEEMSNFDMAKKIYEKIINEYPATKSALSAQEWVHHLNDPEFIENLQEAQKRIKEIGGKQRPVLIASTAGILILVIIGVFIFIKRKKKTTV